MPDPVPAGEAGAARRGPLTIRRQGSAAGMRGEALFSRCGRYRYRLSRVWNASGLHLLAVMLNPSTATESRSDPTLRRCLGLARSLGFGRLTVVNLFALAATDPRALRAAEDPVGPGNDAVIRRAAARADAVLCAWGAHGALAGRGAAVARMLRDSGRPLLHLGLTLGGEPRHPLYLGRDLRPVPWSAPSAAAACPAGPAAQLWAGATEGGLPCPRSRALPNGASTSARSR